MQVEALIQCPPPLAGLPRFLASRYGVAGCPRGYVVSLVAAFLTIASTTITSVNAISDISACVDERVRTAILLPSALAEAEAACGRILAGDVSVEVRQKAAFYRGLMRFLQVVQSGARQAARSDGTVAYDAPTLGQVRHALADVETAIDLDGPLKGEALALRVTIKQTIGYHAEVQPDLDRATKAAPGLVTPLVQRALEHERAGDVTAALSDLDRALELDPAAGAALSARGELLRRLGVLTRARADFAAAAALGPPFRRLALMRKSNVELRAGNLKVAYDDLLAAAAETADMPEADAATANAALLVRAGDLALDKLKDAGMAERHYRDAARLVGHNWSAALGLARVAEQQSHRDEAATIYRRILAATEATPKLFERMLASFRLKQLSVQPQRRSARDPFRNAFEIGVTPEKGSPDGLKRVAFVIGAGNYAALAGLPNARRDAAVMANALAEMGFDTVEIADNPDTAALREVPAAIASRAAEADVVLVFYAGHGVEIDGVNYLIPVDAAPESDKDLKVAALALSDLTRAAAMARRGALVIVDACRDDPFAEARAVAVSRSRAAPHEQAVPTRLHTGLVATPVIAANSVAFHSTQPGQAALDGEGLDSPFVRALLETLGTPNQPFEAVVRDTTARVAETTQGRQVPAAYGTAPAIALLPPAMAQ